MMNQAQLDTAEEILELIKQAPEIERLINETPYFEFGENFISFSKGTNTIKIEVKVFEFEKL